MQTPHNTKSLDKNKLSKTTPSGKAEHVFAYMRRSTKKEEQSESLLQQAEGIKNIANTLNISLTDIRFFTESRSGFENRTRQEWNKMIAEIDEFGKRGEKCTLLCRDSSRLSRNPTDNLAIADRLFGDNNFHKKPVIENIYMLDDGVDLLLWDRRTDKESIISELHNNYMSSLSTKKKSHVGKIIRLENGEYTGKAPYGLKKVNYKGNPREHKKQPTILAQNEFMPHIKKVFEMKVAGKTAKEISRYMKQYGGFYIRSKGIVETIISNTVYKGWYTDEASERVFKIKFWEGKAPIEESLWQKANDTVGKRGNGFGKGQNEHIFVGRIRSDIGTSFQVYIATGKTGTGKHYNYKGTTKDKTGNINNIYISEANILEYLVKEIRKVSDAIMKKIQLIEDAVLAKSIHESLKQEIRMIPEMVHLTDEELDVHVSNLINGFEDYITAKGASASGSQSDGQFVDVLRGEVESSYSQEEKNIVEFGLTKDRVQHIDDNQFGHTQDLRRFLETKMQLRDEIIEESLQSSPYLHNLKGELELQQQAIQQFEEQKKQLEKDLDGVYDDCYAKGFDKSFGDRQAQKINERLYGLDKTIDELKNNETLHTTLQKLPTILSKIVELSSGALGKAKIKESREEIKLILEIIAVELQINNKKELKIKLFEGLDDILDDEN